LQIQTNDADNIYAVGQQIVLTAVVTNNGVTTLNGGMQATVTMPDGTQQIVFGPKRTAAIPAGGTAQQVVWSFTFETRHVGRWSATVVYGVQKKKQKPTILCSAGVYWTVSKAAPPAPANCEVTISTDKASYETSDLVTASVKVTNKSESDPLQGSLFLWLVHPDGTKQNVGDDSIDLPPSTGEQSKHGFYLDKGLAAGNYTVTAELVPSLGLGGCQASTVIAVTPEVCTRTITVESLTGKTTFAPGEKATLRIVTTNNCSQPLQGAKATWFESGGVRTLLLQEQITVWPDGADTEVVDVAIPTDAADGAAKIVVQVIPNDGSSPIEGSMSITVKAVTCEKKITLTELTGKTAFQPGDKLQLQEVFENTCAEPVVGTLVHWIVYAGETTKQMLEYERDFTIRAGSSRVEYRIGDRAIRLPDDLPEGTSKLIVELFPNDGSASITGTFDVPACKPEIKASLTDGSRFYPGETVTVSREVEACASGNVYGSMKTWLDSQELFLVDPDANPPVRERGPFGEFSGIVEIPLPSTLSPGDHTIYFQFVADDGTTLSVNSNKVTVTVLKDTESRNK